MFISITALKSLERQDPSKMFVRARIELGIALGGHRFHIPHNVSSSAYSSMDISIVCDEGALLQGSFDASTHIKRHPTWHSNDNQLRIDPLTAMLLTI
jgi:hypothetical protein